LTNKLDYWNIS